MAEIQHPPIDFSLTRDLSLERIFAEEAFQLINGFGYDSTVQIGSTICTIPVTELVDLTAQDQSDIAFRITGLPVFSSNGSKFEASAEYYVMELQYGLVDDECDMATEEDYEWEPYVRVIVNANDTDDIAVLNAKTCQEMTGDDLARANFTLALMRQELRGMQFEDDLYDLAEYTSDSTSRLELGGFAVFSSSEFLKTSACHTCGTVNQACQHAPYTLN